MQVSVEQSGDIERKLTILIPSEKIEGEISKKLIKIAKQARIHGFRPGKAPMNVINRRYSSQVIYEVVNDTINSSYTEAINQEKIIPAGLLSIDPKPYEKGQDLEYVATIELYPEISSLSLEGETIEKPLVEVKDEDVDRTIEEIRRNKPEYKAKEGASTSNDRLTIDFEGKIAGALFEGGSAEGFQFVLGKGQMLEAFDKGLLGVKKDEVKMIGFSFPEDYGHAEIAGKEVRFQVTVKNVEKAVLPKVDDAFAEQLGIKKGGVGKMKEEIRLNLTRELDAQMHHVLRDLIMNMLHSNNPIKAPQTLVEERIDQVVKSMAAQLESQKLSADKINRDNYKEEATKYVCMGLIIRSVIEKHEIQVDEAAVQERVGEMAASYDDSEDFVNQYMADSERLSGVRSLLMEEKVIEKMLESAQVVEKPMSFHAFMKPPEHNHK